MNSLRIVRLIAGNTFLEAVRQKLFLFLVLIAGAFIVSSFYFRDLDFGFSELKFISDFGFGAIVFFGSILSIAGAAQLFFNEIENRTALTILAKPVRRIEFILGKFAGVWAVVLAFTAMMTLLLMLILWYREGVLMGMERFARDFPEGRKVLYGDILWVGFLQWLKFGILISITMIVAGFARTNLFTVVISFFILIICHLQYLARDAWAEIAFWPARMGVAAMGFAFPNFQVFNVGEYVALYEPLPWSVIASLVGLSAIYIIVYNILAVVSFRSREI
ncbi:MAG: ABC transporter permease [Opitutales bacterium]|nr:ABC transporter permease [Opitutales bacterium]